MKHTDFQIGDYVYHVNKIVKVATLSNSDVTLSVTDNLGTYFAVYNNIKPIPITPEILEKNGFWEGNLYECYIIDKVELINKNNSWTISICITDGRGIDLDIQYVHELQHTLRMAKIDKEIEL